VVYRPRALACAAIATLLAAMAACGGSTPPAGPSPNAALDAGLARSLQAQLDEKRSKFALPGVTAAVTFSDGTQWTGSSGVAEVRPLRRMTPQTPMPIGSVTKPFVAALVLALAEQGRLRLDDRLSRWLPTYPNARSVTLRQLLSHTSGLFNVDENESYVKAVDRALGRDWTPAQVLRYVRQPYFAPGEGWHYSDTNYVLLGLVIKRATATTVAAEMHRRVLDPQGLEDAVLQPDEPAPRGSARGYGTQGPTIPRPGRYVSYRSIASSEWTAAGMVATAPELARWGQALFTGRVVTRESLKQMLDFVPADMIGYTGYGLGIGQRHIVERDVQGATGTHPGFASEMWHDPTQHATVAVLWNDPTILHGPEIADTLLELVRTHHGDR
jgi:D-alanyl-D-alanine carboxypeptidase